MVFCMHRGATWCCFGGSASAGHGGHLSTANGVAISGRSLVNPVAGSLCVACGPRVVPWAASPLCSQLVLYLLIYIYGGEMAPRPCFFYPVAYCLAAQSQLLFTFCLGVASEQKIQQLNVFLETVKQPLIDVITVVHVSAPGIDD